MKIEEIRNRRQFINFMIPYGNYVEFIIGNYYTIRIVNIAFDIYEIKQYDEAYYKEDSKRKYAGFPCIYKSHVNAEDCVNLIITEFRKLKLDKIKERICSKKGIYLPV